MTRLEKTGSETRPTIHANTNQPGNSNRLQHHRLAISGASLHCRTTQVRQSNAYGWALLWHTVYTKFTSLTPGWPHTVAAQAQMSLSCRDLDRTAFCDPRAVLRRHLTFVIIPYGDSLAYASTLLLGSRYSLCFLALQLYDWPHRPT